MKTKVVLLSGKQGSGKSSIQKALMQLWALGDRHIAINLNFADTIYEMHDAVLEILNRNIPPNDLRRSLVKDGPLLQVLGTEWGRKTLGENVWVEILKSKISWDEQNHTAVGAPPCDEILFVVGDCRFENEFKAFPDALKVRLDASETIRRARCSMWRTNTAHASETDLDRYHRENRFDMYLDTGAIPVVECANLILNRICMDALNEPRL